MELASYIIDFMSSAFVLNKPENFLTEIRGQIQYWNGSDCYDEVGELSACYADLKGAINCGRHPHDVLHLDVVMELFYSALYDSKTSGFKESVQNLFDHEVSGINLLILNRVVILPEHRGRGLGLSCLYRCMQQYQHGCGLVALNLSPLQFEPIPEEYDYWRQRSHLQGFSHDREVSIGKLEKYYQRLGFKKIPGTEVMALTFAESRHDLCDG